MFWTESKVNAYKPHKTARLEKGISHLTVGHKALMRTETENSRLSWDCSLDRTFQNRNDKTKPKYGMENKDNSARRCPVCSIRKENLMELLRRAEMRSSAFAQVVRCSHGERNGFAFVKGCHRFHHNIQTAALLQPKLIPNSHLWCLLQWDSSVWPYCSLGKTSGENARKISQAWAVSKCETMVRLTGMHSTSSLTSIKNYVIRNYEINSVIIQPVSFFFFPKKQQSHNGLHKTTSSSGTWRSLEGKEHQSYCTVSAVLKGDWAASPRNVQPEILRKSQKGRDVLCKRQEEAYFISFSKSTSWRNGLDGCSWAKNPRWQSNEACFTCVISTK